MKKTTSSLRLTNYGRLESELRLSGCTYQLRIILHIVPAVISWYLKRNNYGGENQTGLVTLGNGQKALSPHPGIQPRNENHTGAVRFGREFT